MKGNLCHRCGIRLEDAEVPMVTYIVVGPVTSLTPDELVLLYGQELSPYQVANLTKRMARSVYCGPCGAYVTQDIPESEVDRINQFSAGEPRAF